MRNSGSQSPGWTACKVFRHKECRKGCTGLRRTGRGPQLPASRRLLHGYPNPIGFAIRGVQIKVRNDQIQVQL